MVQHVPPPKALELVSVNAVNTTASIIIKNVTRFVFHGFVFASPLISLFIQHVKSTDLWHSVVFLPLKIFSNPESVFFFFLCPKVTWPFKKKKVFTTILTAEMFR